MSQERTESDYYTFREFDGDNARSVLSFYTQFFTEGPVLELACGTGVFLDLLGTAGVPASGVDLDPGMVEQARARGHDVALADALDHLRATPDASLTGLFAAHFLEHLPSEAVQEVYVEAARVLKVGGVFVAAVPSAACLSVLQYDFWRDPTHVRFYDPMALAFFALQAGLEVGESGGNPRNHPGAPGQLNMPDALPFGDLSADLDKVVQGAKEPPESRLQRNLRRIHKSQRPTVTATVHQLVHLIGVLDERLQNVQHQLASEREIYQRLLRELYPSNEAYVLARRVAVDADPGQSE
jgi:SAM-dependent methyltransferase